MAGRRSFFIITLLIFLEIVEPQIRKIKKKSNGQKNEIIRFSSNSRGVQLKKFNSTHRI